MTAIGLTGGIGSGKSSIARILKQIGYPVYIADIEAARLMSEHPVVQRALITRFSSSVYTQEGKINKPFLSQIIFNDPLALADMNRIVHPYVIEDFQHWSKHQKSRLLFFESAIIFEANLNQHFTYTICVVASESTRIQRVLKRDQITQKQIEERISNQLSDSAKCQQANFIINNDNKDMIIKQVLDIITQIDLQIQTTKIQ